MFFFMKKLGSNNKRPSGKGSAAKAPPAAGRVGEPGPVIGRRRFEKISAVEEIVTSEGMAARVADFERRGASAEERRSAIIRAYRKD